MNARDEGAIHLPVYGFAAGDCHTAIRTTMISTLCVRMYTSRGMRLVNASFSPMCVCACISSSFASLAHLQMLTPLSRTLNAMMFCLPVAARAILMALSTASLPLLQKKKRDRCAGQISVSRSISPSCVRKECMSVCTGLVTQVWHPQVLDTTYQRRACCKNVLSSMYQRPNLLPYCFHDLGVAVPSR